MAMSAWLYSSSPRGEGGLAPALGRVPSRVEPEREATPWRGPAHLVHPAPSEYRAKWGPSLPSVGGACRGRGRRHCSYKVESQGPVAVPPICSKPARLLAMGLLLDS